MNETNISWTGFTWNPVSGCEKVTEGCKFCYAETFAERHRGGPAFPNGFDLTIRPHKLREPFKLKTPSLIFVNSMSDLFWDKIPEDYRNQIVDVIEANPQHRFQVLTKRAEAMLEYSRRRRLPPNFWAGVTIENARNLHRLEVLKQVEAHIRFISFEPLIGPIPYDTDLSGIQWAIVGGESGNHLFEQATQNRRALVYYDQQRKTWTPRIDRVHWVRDIREACYRDDVAFFFKQWGGSKPTSAGDLLDGIRYHEMPEQSAILLNPQ